MKAQKKFEIQEPIFFRGVKTHFGKHIFRQEKKFNEYYVVALDPTGPQFCDGFSQKWS